MRRWLESENISPPSPFVPFISFISFYDPLSSQAMLPCMFMMRESRRELPPTFRSSFSSVQQQRRLNWLQHPCFMGISTIEYFALIQVLLSGLPTTDLKKFWTWPDFKDSVCSRSMTWTRRHILRQLKGFEALAGKHCGQKTQVAVESRASERHERQNLLMMAIGAREQEQKRKQRWHPFVTLPYHVSNMFCCFSVFCVCHKKSWN